MPAFPSRRPRFLLRRGLRSATFLLVVASFVAPLVAGCASAAVSSATVTPVASAAALPTLAATASATAAAATPTASFPLSLTDDESNHVAIAAVPKRIISLTPGTTEIAFALGVGSRVVGVTDADDYPPQVKQLPKVATFQGVDVEKIVGLRPDLVLAGGNGFNKPESLQRLRDLGIPVLVVYAPDVPGVLADIRLVGTALGEGDRAVQLATAMQTRMDAIHAAAAAAGSAPRVFYELDATNQIYGPAAKSFVAGMISTAGGDPITTGDPNVFSISLEKLVAADPQVILLGDAAYGTTVAQVSKRPGWGGMTAVRTGAVRPVDDTVITRPGPRLAQGLADLAVAIHPAIAIPPGAPLPAWSAPSNP